MKKQIKVSLTATAALLALAGIAQAAPAELNIYGASAQYDYWNAQSKNYAETSLGCVATEPVNNNKKHGFVAATNCTSTLVPVNSATGQRDLDIRYSGIASAEGPLATDRKAPLDPALAAGCNVANGERLMYASSSTLVCKQVHLGTSDVAGESLNQTSSGQKFGPLGGGQFDVALTGVDTTNLTPHNTVVVPFGFFVNAGVTAKSCTAGLVGNYCSADTECDTAPGKLDGACGAPATITNISREEANLLFAGFVYDWADLGAYYTSQPAVVCLRHAGSGTHSTLDNTVMYSGWGNNVTVAEEDGHIWFNQGSSDEMKCINGNTTATPAGSLSGAIGYADADQKIGEAGKSDNVKQLKYNGYYPTRTAIRNGQYDFYSNAWLYTNLNSGTTVNAIAADMIAYAQLGSNVPATKANYWAAQGEMRWNRAADNAYPTYLGGAADPQTP